MKSTIAVSAGHEWYNYLMGSLFLDACRGEPTPRPPLWLMRQAGRYLPEYREVRNNVTFLELCKTPLLAAKVTMQPIRRFGFDAAILFSDLLIPLEAMGQTVSFTEDGPTLAPPVRSAADLARLALFDPWERTPFVLEAIRLVRPQLGETPLIGFAGAPFTTATYAIEGKTSRRFVETKKLFYREPQTAHQLLELIESATRSYLLAQVAAGAQAIQIFDSWLGRGFARGMGRVRGRAHREPGGGGEGDWRAGHLLPQWGHHHSRPRGARGCRRLRDRLAPAA